MMLLLKLLVAHLIGDFFLQPYRWVKSKEEEKARGLGIYLHVLVHALLVLAITWDWRLMLLVGGIHLVIDVLKQYAQSANTRRFWFFLDQGLHLLSLLVIYWLWEDIPVDPQSWITETNLIYLAAVLLLTRASSFIISTAISRWTPETGNTEDTSLQNAGQWIGMLERLFIFGFILSGHWEGVGFLLAAKSIFRFGDLTASKNRELTEYVLIGTLLSFGLAMATAMVVDSIR